MPAEVPETSLAAETTIDEEVETIDAKQGRITLTSREDVKGRMTESDVADDVWRGKLLLNWLRHQEWFYEEKKRYVVGAKL